MIHPVLGKLLDSLVIRKNIAMDTAHQGNSDFQDGNKEVIRGLTDRPITHQCRYVNTLALFGLLLGQEEDKVGFRDDVEACSILHKDRGVLMIHVMRDFID